MEGCQCLGSRLRPPCYQVTTNISHGAIYNSHEDVSRLIFTRESASKYLGPDVSSLTATTTTTTNRTFTLFPLLPPEIRLKIWRSALSVPRLVVISSTSCTVTPTPDGDAIVVDCPPLPLCSQACRESRGETLRVYDKCFATIFDRQMCLFNFEHDRFLIGGPDPFAKVNFLIAAALPDYAHKVRFLHISQGNQDIAGSARRWAPLRERFTALKELIISLPANGPLPPYEYYGALYPPLTRESKIRSELYDCVKGEGRIDIKRWNPAFQLKIIQYPNPENELLLARMNAIPRVGSIFS
ncbi:hypothetical protein V496_04063 [Pseudogymnoascus sp. VKM F-4515 (FW-2607)]|nr:hypothetical protein V496_04063 [Pseudogymnoascus sp. VKM F-4515 (FW-2607)]KFY98895.1 hypothetical protein V498_01122 [Pseudogymnoascus sp. VKM F-4517 (FW-2822)]